MLNSKSGFQDRLSEARNLNGLFEYLTQTVSAPFPFDDLLRAQIVYAMSAFDKLIHDLIRIGMLETFVGRRVATAKYKAESISLEIHAAISAATLPPKEVVFEAEVIRKLGFLSFIDPTKLAEGLSLIWNEPQKWEKIGGVIGMTGDDARKRLKLSSVRRNAIVHEADMDLVTGLKRPISSAEGNDITNFVEKCGNAIVGLVL